MLKMNRAQQFRKNPKQREVRINELNQERKNQRNLILGELRQIEKSPQTQLLTNKSPKKKKSRLDLLKEWKLLKQEKENNQKNVKKPPFHAGRIQRKATGSPKVTFTHQSNANSQNRVTTRAQSKRTVNIIKPIILSRLNKADKSGLNPVENHSFALPKGVAALHKEVGHALLTVPMSPKITKSARKSVKPLLTDIGGEFPKPLNINFKGHDTLSTYKKQRSSIFHDIPEFPSKKKALFTEIIKTDAKIEDLQFDNKNKENSFLNCKETELHKKVVKSVPEIGMEYSPENSLRLQSNFEHLAFSPLIEKKRGSNRRISSATKKLYSVDDEIEQEEIIKKSRILSFRLFLSNETHRLLNLAEHWSQIAKGKRGISSDVEGDINAVVGKTKLLTSDKFKQFEGLITKCEGGDPLIKVDDLQGFHDWVSLEIEDLDKTYFSLKESQEKNWVTSPKKQEVKKQVKAKPVPLKKKPAAVSSMRAHIMAARKQMQVNTSPNKLKENEQVSVAKSPSSPRHVACLSTPKDSNLRVKVLQRCSGIEIMTATSKARLSQSPNKPLTPKLPLGNSLITKTPSKSILRMTPAPVSEKKNVLFGLDPIYLQPAQDSPMDDSPDVLQLIENSTPLRRSRRIISKSPGIYKY